MGRRLTLWVHSGVAGLTGSACLLLTGLLGATPATTTEINQSRSNAVGWFVSHQGGDGSWPETNGHSVRTTSAAVLGLLNAGISDGQVLNAALAHLKNTRSTSIDELARQVRALKKAGADVSLLTAALRDARNDKSAWGAYPHYGGSLPDTPLALMASFESGTFDSAHATDTLCFGLLYALRSDGSFSYLVNGTSTPANLGAGSLLPTSYAVRALSDVVSNLGFSQLQCGRFENGPFVFTTFTLSTIINNAVSWLLARQDPASGGFQDGGAVNPFDTALAYLAIARAAPTTQAAHLAEALGYLVHGQSPDGSFGSDALTTALALQTLPARAASGVVDSDGDGVPDEVEASIGTNASQAERTGASGNGHAIEAVTTSRPLPAGTRFGAYQLDLPGVGSAIDWTILAGALPSGLTLNAATGAITGTPTVSGLFNFTYEVTGASGSQRVSAQINIADAPAANAVPAAPPIVLLILAVSLVGLARRSRR